MPRNCRFLSLVMVRRVLIFAGTSSWEIGCGFFAYGWKLPAYSRAFLLTVDDFSFFAYSWSFFAYSFRQLELFCLQREGASNQGLKGL